MHRFFVLHPSLNRSSHSLAAQGSPLISPHRSYTTQSLSLLFANMAADQIFFFRFLPPSSSSLPGRQLLLPGSGCILTVIHFPYGKLQCKLILCCHLLTKQILQALYIYLYYSNSIIHYVLIQSTRIMKLPPCIPAYLSIFPSLIL